MKFQFGCPAWGEHYVGLFLEFGLPSQLAALEGAGELTSLHDCSYTIYTLRADYERMLQHPMIDRLLKIMPVSAYLLDDAFRDSPGMNAQLPPGGTNNLVGLRIVHGKQVAHADEEKAAIFFLQADQIWSRGAFTKAMRMISAGRRAVLCAGPRVVNNAAVRAQLRALDGFEPRDLMRLAFGYGIHPETETWFWDSPNYNQYSTYMLFHAPGGVLCQGWVYHPLVVYPHEDRYNLNFNIFDQDFLAGAVNPSEAYLIDDSDDLCQISLAPRHIEQLQADHDPHLDPIVGAAWYASAHYQKFHTLLFNVPVHLHWEKPANYDWREAYTLASEIRRLINDVVHGDLSWLAEYYPDVCLRQMDNRAFRGLGEAYPESVRELALRVKALRRHREWHPPTDGKENTDEMVDVVSGVGGPAPRPVSDEGVAVDPHSAG